MTFVHPSKDQSMPGADRVVVYLISTTAVVIEFGVCLGQSLAHSGFWVIP